MNKVTREQLLRDSRWGRVPDDARYVIYSPTGRIYDTYPDRETALRVLGDVAKRYGDGYAAYEVVDAVD